MRKLWIAFLAAVPVVPQAPIPKYEVKRATAPVTVDGKLDEAAWAGASAPVALQFLWDHQTGAKQKYGLDAGSVDSLGEFRGTVTAPTRARHGMESELQPLGRRSAGPPHEHLV